MGTPRAQNAQKPPRMVTATNTYYIAVGTLLLGAIVSAVGISLTTAPAMDELRQENQVLQDRADAAEEKAAEETANMREIRDNFLDGSAELDEREAALDAREAQLTSAEQQQAANEMTGGMHTVGTTVTAGTYVTTVTSGMCYYAWKSGTGSDADIVNNNIVEQGPATVTLVDGQIFENRGCGTWTKQ